MDQISIQYFVSIHNIIVTIHSEKRPCAKLNAVFDMMWLLFLSSCLFINTPKYHRASAIGCGTNLDVQEVGEK